jgi:hypothetical protein
VLCISENLSAKEGDDMVRDDLDRLIPEVGVIDAKVGIKPLNFVRDELARDESLRRNK